jgi:hypothetical protein
MNRLTERLIEIGRVSDPNEERASNYLGDARKEAFRIGRELDRLGGLPAMVAAHREVARRLGGAAARELELVWHGIGDWRG